MPLWANSGIKIVQKRGDFFGEVCMMGRPQRRLSAIAKEHCILLELNKDAFEILMKDSIKKEQFRLSEFLY